MEVLIYHYKCVLSQDQRYEQVCTCNLEDIQAMLGTNINT